MTGGLYVFDGIDVVATLVREEAETRTTETQLRDREQESIAIVDYEDPSTSETIEAHDAKTGGRLDTEEVRIRSRNGDRRIGDAGDTRQENLVEMG